MHPKLLPSILLSDPLSETLNVLSQLQDWINTGKWWWADDKA